MFRPKRTRIKLYNTLALPTLLYGSENWTIKARDATRMTAAEMKYMSTVRYTWSDHRINTVCKGIKYNPIFGQNTGLQYKMDILQHINRMPRNRLRRLIKKLQPKRQKEPRKTTKEISGPKNTKCTFTDCVKADGIYSYLWALKG
jgi:hypothetical protein